MDFNDSPELAQFRQDVRTWLENNAPARTDNLYRGMEGDDVFREAKQWYKKVAEAGFACLTWPKEYGGAGLTQIHDVIWSQEVANFETRDSYFVIGIGNMVLPSCTMALRDEKRAAASHGQC